MHYLWPSEIATRNDREGRGDGRGTKVDGLVEFGGVKIGGV